ncbi:hypothetical protein HMI54_011895 [Coelomomyces lativittatus]|nr:hypothetical protein HMI54_011895 [Coelomomyces lativittatus]
MLDELYTLNESSTTDAIKIAKKLRSVSRLLDHLKPDVSKDEPEQNTLPRRATEAPKVEVPKVFFDSRIPDRVVGHLRQLLQDLEKYNESKDVVFLAQLAQYAQNEIVPSSSLYSMLIASESKLESNFET